MHELYATFHHSKQSELNSFLLSIRNKTNFLYLLQINVNHFPGSFMKRGRLKKACERKCTAIVDRLFQFRRRLSTVPGRKVVRDVEFVIFVLRGPRRHRNILLVAVYAYPLSMSRILLRTLRPDRFSLTLRKWPLAEPLHRIIGGPSTALVLA